MFNAGGECARALSAKEHFDLEGAARCGKAGNVNANSDGTGLKDQVLVGEISGVYGVRGWVKVHSSTSPADGIVDYSPWRIGHAGDAAWQEFRVASGRAHGATVVAKLDGVDDRDEARRLVGSEIAIARSLLPPAPNGCYYWADLIGLTVFTLEGDSLGTVSGMIETGANDVLIVDAHQRQRLVPFVPGTYVKGVDLNLGRITVDWNPDF